MPKDYARPSVNVKKPKPKKRPAKSKRPGFHGPSFSAGLLLGGAVVILGAYAPELAEEQLAKLPEATPQEPEFVFEFDDLLRKSEVPTNPEVYASEADDDPDAVREYLIQAASFRHVDDAEQLRAQLTLEALPVDMTRVNLDSGIWYRVTVGPMTSSVEASRVMTRLRGQNLSAIWIKRG